MASPFSHAVVALSIGSCFYRPQIAKRVWVAGVLCSVIPELDVIGFRFGIHYGNFWGHRGFTHSLVFAAVLAIVVTSVLFRRGASEIGRFALLGYLFLATASHGVLDAMTNGGLGVAFLSPFDTTRYFLPWRPIRVSPIAAHRFFSARGYAVLWSELLWNLGSGDPVCRAGARVPTQLRARSGGEQLDSNTWSNSSIASRRRLT